MTFWYVVSWCFLRLSRSSIPFDSHVKDYCDRVASLENWLDFLLDELERIIRVAGCLILG